MGYIKDCTSVADQCFLQDLLGSNIQMVGRLVKDQEVGFGKHQLCKGNTASFSTGKCGDLLENIISGKEKCSKHISDLGLCESRISIGDLLENRLVHMQNMMFLIVITDLHLGTKGKFAGICLNKTVDDLQHGGLSGSVVSDQCHTLAAFDIKGDIGEQGLSRKGLGKRFHVEHIVSA